jgi:regulator of sigma E protease
LEYAIGLTVVILKVAFGLGFVIFVHELGHFVVAKMCGVKCEKFYLGFDIAGLKFCKFRYGETEYGIGILPLGGYVKMLGQEDNPARLREEMERAKGLGTSVPSETATTTETTTPSPLPAPLSQNNAAAPPVSGSALYDPRSYLAKSVPKRMAIISAGVIMNLIFAFLMAVVAFGIGVPEPPCIVGEVYAGEAAWQANIRPGDEILEIGGKKMRKFRNLQAAITLGDIDPKEGVPFLIRRDGKELSVTLKPQNSLGIYAIGVAPQYTTRLLSNQRTWMVFNRHAVIPGSTAAKAGVFENGDRIIQIDDTPIGDYTQINSELARKASQKIVVTVERAEKNAEGEPTSVVRRIKSAVEPQPLQHLGLIMKMGPITSIQAGSPAEAAGIKPGDRLIEPGDPMTLPDRLARQAGKTIQLKLKREEGKEPITCSVQLREPNELAPSVFRNSPVGVPALGIAYRVLNEVERVIEGSPADKAGMKPGDSLLQAKFVAPSEKELDELGVNWTEDLAGSATMEFGKEKRSEKEDEEGIDNNWPAFMNALQSTLPGTKIELTFLRNGKKQTVPGPDQPPLEPVTTTEAFDPERGFRFEPMTIFSHAKSFGGVVALAAKQTLDDVTVTYSSVRALGTGQVPLRGLAGPWGIIKIALQAADQGTAKLLLFLVFLSANLAVLNFLPIPVLDGGHFVLLAYEGIRGKPASENVQTVLAYIGLAFILTLMIWVFGLDFGLISRH